ncbi:MAG: hypothetical protein ACN4GR_10165, partial [Arenicellales bacterium]
VLTFGLDLPVPFRLAETRRMSWRFRGVLSEHSAFHTPPAHPSIAGNPKGKHAGALDILLVCLFEQAKKSHSSIKDEKHGLIQEKE